MAQKDRCAAAVVLVAAAVLLGGCGPTSASILPPSSPGPAFPPVLSIDSRGGPPVIVKAGAVELARVACSSGAVVTPGDTGVPPLPWNLSVVTQGDGTVLLTSTVTELPKWILIIGDHADIGSTPVAGPSGPPCPSGP